MFEKDEDYWEARKESKNSITKVIKAWSARELTIHDVGFVNGAEFGYNKANEWHFVKDKLPEKGKYVLVYTKFENVYIARLVKDNYFINKKGGFVQTSDVIAWKEFVSPKESE